MTFNRSKIKDETEKGVVIHAFQKNRVFLFN